jgi:hypothetical protein
MKWIEAPDKIEVGAIIHWPDDEGVYRVIAVQDELRCVQLRKGEPVQKDRGNWKPEPQQNQTESTHMISLKTNDRGSTIATPTETTKETPLNEIVAGYNALATKLGSKTVTRFKNRETAIKRFSELKATQPAADAATTPKEGAAMATKKKAKKTAPAPKEDKRSKISQEFGARLGTNREKLIEALHGSFGKFVPINQLLKAVFGSMNEENRGALAMVMKGVEVMIKDEKLPYKTDRKKDDKGLAWGLFKK